MITMPKSLHTVTAVTNVARYLYAIEGRYGYPQPVDLACAAFTILGYDPSQLSIDDPTAEKIYRECQKIIDFAERERLAA